MHRIFRVAAILLSHAVLADLLPAQDAPPTILEGYVVDAATGLAVPGVLIRAESGIETLADDGGWYLLEGLPAGTSRLVLVTPTCNVTWATVTLAPEEIRVVVFQVPPGADTEPGESESEEWRRRVTGSMLTAEEIEAMNARTVLDVIRRAAPGLVGGEGQVGAVPALRSRSAVSGRGVTEPVVVVDGVVVDGPRSLVHIHPSDVETLEISKSAAAGWAYGSQGSGGVIRLTTKRGGEAHGHPGPRPCAVPPFPSDGSPADPPGRGGPAVGAPTNGPDSA